MTFLRRVPDGRVSLRGVALVALALTLCLCAAGATATTAAAQEAAPDVTTTDGLLTWISRNPQHAGLAVLPDRRSPAISFGAGRRSPLASTRKILVAGALTASHENLSTRVPRSAVERFYVRGTDGGAHERAKLHATRPTLRQLLRAMIEVSDNASADALLERLGAPAVDAWARRQGLTRQDPIYPVFGELVAWTRDPGWTAQSPRERARSARALSHTVAASEVGVPEISEQRRLASSSIAGTPAQWARLMRRIAHHGDPYLVRALDWPRRKTPRLARKFDRLMTKGGSLPGVISEASYVRPAGRAGMAIALFLRDLPADVELALSKTFAQQDLILRLATDKVFRERARRLLGAAEQRR